MKNYKTEIRDSKLLMEFEKDNYVDISEKEAEKKLLEAVPEEYDTPGDSELIYTIQDIVNRVYPHIANNLGKSVYADTTPPVEIWKDIYARLSGIPEAEGEHSSTSKAEYDDKENKIFIYYPNMEDTEDIIRSLLHEYTHYLQDPVERKGHREEGYENDPDEIEAAKAEEKWGDYLIYLKDNISEAQEDRKTGEDLEKKLTPEDGYEEHTDFTPTQVRILNYLAKQFTHSELQTIATRDPGDYDNKLGKKWGQTLKLFGEPTGETRWGNTEEYGKSTRFAKWIVDNYDAAQTEDFADDSLDFGRVTNPIKAWPSVYEIEGREEGWEQVYKSGYIDMVAYDAEEARARAEETWWDYEPDMETDDYGDYEQEDFNIGDVTHTNVLKEQNIDISDTDNISPDLEIGDRIMVWDLTPDPSPPGGSSDYPDGAVKMPRTLIGTVIDSLDDDEIDLESFRGGIKYIVRDDSTGEEYGLYRGADGYSEPYLDRDKWVKLPPTNLNESKKILGKGMMSPRAFDTYCIKI